MKLKLFDCFRYREGTVFWNGNKYWVVVRAPWYIGIPWIAKLVFRVKGSISYKVKPLNDLLNEALKVIGHQGLSEEL